MDWKYLFTGRDGRINRQPFWIGTVVLIVASIVLMVLVGALVGPVIALILMLPIFYAGFALSLKRAHDRDRPDWYVIGYYVLAVLLNIAMATTDPMNPGMLINIGMIVSLIWGLILLVDLGFLRGTPGPNQHGPDPLAS
jgi:uncharacterized membrane protein YhaH (DUF805 family)